MWDVDVRIMKYIYLLLWLASKKKSDADGKYYEEYNKVIFSRRVVGGVQVPISMYPHVAVLLVNEIHTCGGSIISDRVILTAAHCVVSHKNNRLYPPKAIQVYLGSTHLGHGIKYDVCKVTSHDSFNLRDNNAHPVYFYDVAVLRFCRRINFGPTIQKVRIAPNKTWRKEKSYFTVAGFGIDDNNGGISEKLLAARLHYVDSRTCNQTQSTLRMIVPDHMFCMIGHGWTSDCYGDSGSGVMWRGYLVGVVAIARAPFCGSDTIPTMYTDATYFRKWINSKIKEAKSLSKHRKRNKKNKLWYENLEVN